jgi:tRNA nucleotidyltransferase (CCA-adding enzyme)
MPAGLEAAIPEAVIGLLGTLWSAGHAAYLVGGSLRDIATGRRPVDWDLASDARPERVVALFPGSVYENRFGTVGVRRDGEIFEITTFRTDHDYADFRRPHRVEFGDSIELDLARRDFTVNAMAWGAAPGEAPALLDPFDGLADLDAGVLRAVGDPPARFEEDALRMIRAVRLAATLGFTIESTTLAAMQARAGLAVHLSGERIESELTRLLAAPRPSGGLRLLHDTGLLEAFAPELAAQRGVPQNKVAGEDLWDHTMRSVDAVDPAHSLVRMAALLHDIGKPATFADGHFVGHDQVGAAMAGQLLDRLHVARARRDRVVELVRNHMFSYEPNWSAAAVRRFIGRMATIGPGALDQLLQLREADNVGSGLPADAGHMDELRSRVLAELASDAVLDLHGLAIDGDDLMAALGLEPGPQVGAVLDGLLDRVIVDPASNRREVLLSIARTMLADPR